MLGLGLRACGVNFSFEARVVREGRLVEEKEGYGG